LASVFSTAGDFADPTNAGSAASGTATADADAPQPGTGALANYTILKTTDYGKSMTRNFSAKTTARQVVKATVPDLAAFFGQKPKLVGVYQDQKDRKSACVFFSESLGGQPIKGISVIKVTDDATREWVVFCRANAPKGEAMKLLALHKPSQPAVDASAGSTGTGAGGGAVAGVRSRQIRRPMTQARRRLFRLLPLAAATCQSIPPADVKLQTYNFPDGTGSVASPMAGPAHRRRSATASSKGRPTKRLDWISAPWWMCQTGGQFGCCRWGTGSLQGALSAHSPDPATALKNLIEAITGFREPRGTTNTVDEIVSQKPIAAGPECRMPGPRSSK